MEGLWTDLVVDPRKVSSLDIMNSDWLIFIFSTASNNYK